MKVLISHPGFSNFDIFFKKQSNHEIYLHRNYDINSSIFRIFRVLNILNFLEKINTYKLYKKYVNNNIDVLIVIKGCTINYDILDFYSVNYKISLWDSIVNIYNGERYKEKSQNVLSFDLNDSLAFNFKYLPLFHFRGSKVFENNKKSREIISMYGTYSFERACFLDLLNTESLINLPLEYHLTISISHFLREYFLLKRPIRILWKYSTFKKLNRCKIEDMLNRSLATLDIANENQSGMTTRTFEALSHNTKLATNNLTTFNFCKDKNFNVFFLKTKTTKFDKLKFIDFLSKDLVDDQDFLKTYSIENFLNNIINHNQ
jgi:hypothetical protein